MTHKRSPKSRESIYRAILAMRRDMETQLAIVRLDLQAVRHSQLETIPVLIKHVVRLKAEKERLMAVVDAQMVLEANRFIAASGNIRAPKEAV